MHTLRIRGGWNAHVNGDFSGDVVLTKEEGTVNVTVPFNVLYGIVAEYARRQKALKAEAMTDDQALGFA